MVGSTIYRDFLIGLIKSCEYYHLTEKQYLDLINSKLSQPISRSTYYNYKMKLYQGEKFLSLKKSIYKSRLLKCFLLYLDERFKPDGYNFQNLILDKFQEKKNVFEISEEQQDKIERTNKRIQSNLCVRVRQNGNTSNLTRVNQLTEKYTLREEYIRCGKHENGKCKCKSDKHGPYYYAYWREKLPERNKSTVRKKYLGTIDPRLIVRI